MCLVHARRRKTIHSYIFILRNIFSELWIYLQMNDTQSLKLIQFSFAFGLTRPNPNPSHRGDSLSHVCVCVARTNWSLFKLWLSRDLSIHSCKPFIIPLNHAKYNVNSSCFSLSALCMLTLAQTHAPILTLPLYFHLLKLVRGSGTTRTKTYISSVTKWIHI